MCVCESGRNIEGTERERERGEKMEERVPRKSFSEPISLIFFPQKATLYTESNVREIRLILSKKKDTEEEKKREKIEEREIGPSHPIRAAFTGERSSLLRFANGSDIPFKG
jgi:hypothetical protein